MSKHTPGPWIVVSKLSGSENHRGFRIMDGPNAWALADVQPGDEDGDLGRANARLIAAAPCLLAALQGMMRWMPVYPSAADGIAGGREAHAAAFEAARAAIAKTKGVTP